MARILIVTSTHLSRNPRTLKEASTLAGAGHQVAVVTLSNHPRSLELDRALLREAPFRLIPLDFLARGARARTVNFFRRLHTRVARGAVRRFHMESPWALGPAAPLLRLARRHAAELTIVHNELPGWIGMQLINSGQRVAADLEDWYSEDLLPTDRQHRPLRLLQQIEAALLKRAAYASTTSIALACALEQRYGGPRPIVLTNSFPLGTSPARTADGERAPSLVWFSQTVGPGRGLEEFLACWVQSPRVSHLTLIGAIQPGFQVRLAGMLPPSLRGNLSFQDFVPPAELPAVLARHDIGLALEPTAPANKDLTISNKILQYLNASLAVVATPTAGHREVLARGPDAGVIVDFQDTPAAARALDALLADRAALARRQQAARRLAEEVYCWEREAPKLLAAVETALTGAPSP